MPFSQRRQLTRQTWSIVKKAGIAVLAAQAAAVVTVHAIDRMRTARIPGGVHGFPTLPPADTQIGDTVARTYTEGHALPSCFGRGLHDMRGGRSAGFAYAQ